MCHRSGNTRNYSKAKITNLFDAHCDTLTKAYKENIDFFDDTLAVCPSKLAVYNASVQCYAIFNDGSMKMNDIINLIKSFSSAAKNSNSVALCKNEKDIKNAHTNKKIAAILTIESIGNTVDFTADDVKLLKNLGVRMMSLTWNNDNRLCGGIERNFNGLTDYGIKILKEMEKQKMILDVSHISDNGFWEAVRYYALPICASHSNARSVSSNRRNLTDEQIKYIISSGGVIGINFFPDFVGNRENVLKHINHIINLGGKKSLGIGSDFDGIERVFDDLKDASMIRNVFNEMFGQNYLNQLIYDVSYNNFYNFFKKFEILA